MKKVFFALFVLLFVTSVSFAQTPEAGTKGFSAGFNYKGASDGIILTGPSVGSTLLFKYYLHEDLIIRT